MYLCTEDPVKLILDKIEDPSKTFYLVDCFLCHIYHYEEIKEETAMITTMDKFTNKCGHFEDAVIFNRQPMEFFWELEQPVCICYSL